MLDPSADLADETPLLAIRLHTRISNALSNAGCARLVTSRQSSPATLLNFQGPADGTCLAEESFMNPDRFLLGPLPVNEENAVRTIALAGEKRSEPWPR